MPLLYDEAHAAEAFRIEVARRLEEARALWQTYAAKRRLRYVVAPNGLPSLEGTVEGTRVEVSAVGSIALGFHTRAVAEAKVALRGKVVVGPPGDWDELVSAVKHRHYFEDRELDRLLVVKTSSASLARTVLDDRVLQTVRALAPARLELSYDHGAIGVSWAGVERDPALLDDVFDALAYLAVRGSEISPYR